MPDDEFKSPEELEKGAETEVRKRVKSVSGVSDAISQMKLDVEKRAGEIKKIGREEGIAEVSGSVSKVLSKLGDTIGALTSGVKAITISTAKSTKEAISQYGRAISEDISFNKRNIIAMSLSRATPLFGYFAAKFMETDVFRNMAQKIKEKIGGALSTVAAKFSGMISTAWGKARDFVSGIAGKATSIFKREKERPTKTPMSAEGRITSEVNERLKSIEAQIPKLQRGGIVARGGLAEVHAGEIVAPIDKVLDKLDESRAFASEVVKSLVSSLHGMTRHGMRLETYVAQEPTRRRGIIRGFFHAMEQSWKRHEAPANVRMLRALLELKTSLIGETNRWRFIWQKMMYEHPVLRAAVYTFRAFRHVIEFPFSYMFRARGGYIGDLPKSKNMFFNMTQVLGMLYSTGMWKLDQILQVLKASATAQRDLSSAVTGAKYETIPGVGKGGWSIAGKMIRAIASPIELAVKKWGSKEAIEKWTGAREFKWTKPFGVTPKGLLPGTKRLSSVSTLEEQLVNLRKTIEEAVRKALTDFFLKILESRYKSTAEKVTELVKIENKALILEDKGWRFEKKKLSLQERMVEGIKGLGTRLKKVGSQVWKYILMFIGIMRSLIGSVKGLILRLGTRVIGPALSAFFRSKTWSKLFTGLFTKIRGLGVGGTARLGAGAIGLAYGGYEMARGGIAGYKKAEEWGVSRAAGAIGGALGGEEKGWAGAKAGALKGAALGAGIGSIFPGIGTAIGGAVGAIAGGIMGYIGGENIAKGISYVWDGVKKFLGVLKDVIFYPFKLMGQLGKMVWNWLIGKKEDNEKKAKEAADETTGLIDRIANFLKDFGKRVALWLEEKIQKIPVVGSLYGKVKGLFTRKAAEKSLAKAAEFAKWDVYDESIGKSLEGAITKLPPEAIANAKELIRLEDEEKMLREKIAKLRERGSGTITKASEIAKEKARVIAERTPEAIARAKEIARAQAKEAELRARALTKPLMEMQEKAIEKAKEERGVMNTFITNVTNVISSSIQSLSSAMAEKKGQYDAELHGLLGGGLY